MTWPSTLTAYTNPQATDRLNNPSHSSIEQAQNAGLTAVQNFVGVDGASSVVGTLIYDVRSPASNGGGHVQTAVKGGTGQTTFTKGDILAAQSASVIAKLAVGTDGQILASNSSAASGVNWVNNSNPKVISSASYFTVACVMGETSIMNVSIPASTLGTSNVIRGTAFINDADMRANIVVRGIYGGAVVSSVVVREITNYNLAGTIVHTIIANNSGTSQRSFLEVKLATIIPQSGYNIGAAASVYTYYDSKVSSVESGAAKSFGVTLKPDDGNMSTGGFYVERII